MRPHSEVLGVRTTSSLTGLHNSTPIREFKIALRYPFQSLGMLTRLKTETIERWVWDERKCKK